MHYYVKLNEISFSQSDWWSTLQSEVLKDSYYSKMAHASPGEGFKIQDGVWFKKDKVCLSPNSSLIPSLLIDMHFTPVGGHFGYERTLSQLKRDFIWPGMRKSMKEFIKHCDPCQRCKYECVKLAGLLQLLLVPKKVWLEISMDFLEGLSNSQGYNSVMVVVDCLSKYAHFLSLQHLYTALTVAKAFVDYVMKLHGMPHSIVSDRDRIFMSKFWQTLFQL